MADPLTQSERGYRDTPLELDSTQLAADAMGRIEARIPGLQLRPGHIVTLALMEQSRVAQQVAWSADRALRRHAVAAMAERLFGIHRQRATRATGTVEITMIDGSGATLDSGLVVAWQPTGDRRDDIEFRTTESVAVNPGQGTVEIPVEAVVRGDDANGVPEDEPLSVIQAIPAVDTARMVSETSGGQDSESVDEYLDRVVIDLELLSEAAVTISDFEVLARRTPGVHRALALADYDPDEPEDTSPRHVTLVPIDDDGEPVSESVAAQLVDDLDEARTVNAVVHTIEPSYTAVEVEFTVRRLPGFDSDDVLDSCEQAVEAMISPSNWAGGTDSPPEWRPRTTVRYLEVASLIASVAGVDFVETLTVNGSEQDVALDGTAPLPAPFEDGGSSVDGEVTTP